MQKINNARNQGKPMRSLRPLIPVLLLAASAAFAQPVPVCALDDSVKERFLPVELLTGNPMTENKELVLAPIDRVYPFVDELPGGGVGKGDVALKGPVKWQGAGGTVYEVYERRVNRTGERYALTADRTAMGRVFDDRIGNITNEGKYPVGVWQQGQKRSYKTVYATPIGTRNGTSTLEIEKLSCTYEGTPGAMQYGWTTDTGQSYAYIYVPGRGLTHVMTRSQSRR